MGNSAGKFISEYVPQSVTEACKRLGNKRKRKCSSEDDESNLEESLHSPKKRKLICTTQYIYKALFVEGRNHDVVVEALGREWKLHKVYLTQSPYFQSMFCGSWKETHNKYIRIEVADPNITLDSLKVVFGSLYLDEVTLEPASVVGVLAAAILFQLDCLIEQSLGIMVEHISPLTAVSYFEAANQYGLQRIKTTTVKWFLINLTTYYPGHTKRLRLIESDLMCLLVQDKDLVVLQTEFCLYMLLRLWAFLKLHPHWIWESDPEQLQVTEFYHTRPDSTPFLLSPEGKDFLRVFQGLRIGSLLTQEQDVRLLIKDRILPDSWVYPVLVRQWKSLLRVDSGEDRGPNDDVVSHEAFFASCVRCGRELKSKESHTWKWRVFNFGLELIWSTLNNVLTVRRTSDENKLSDPKSRLIMFRVTISMLDQQRQVKLTQSSGVMSVMLVRNIEAKIMDLCPDFEYPLVISVNLLSVTPKIKTVSSPSPPVTSSVSSSPVSLQLQSTTT